MYTIIMNEDKEVITTRRTPLYQNEKIADKIRFLFPQERGEIDINECIVVMRYIDQLNVKRTEILAKSYELYKDKVCFILPVDTRLNSYAGDVIIHMSVVRLDTETGEIKNSFETNETIITINPVDYVEPTEEVVNKLLSLEAQINTVKENQIDGLTLTEDMLQLSNRNQPVGNAVQIVVSDTHDGNYDNVNDGILDLNAIYANKEEG